MRCARTSAWLIGSLVAACGVGDNDTPCGQLARWELDAEPTYLPADDPDAERHMQTTIARARLTLWAVGAERFCDAHGRYAHDVAELIAAQPTDPRDDPCRVRDILRMPDPWGSLVSYSLSDGKPRIVSAGADSVFATDDDLTTPELSDPDAWAIDVTSDCPIRGSGP